MPHRTPIDGAPGRATGGYGPDPVGQDGWVHPSVPDPGPAGDPRRPPRADPERSADQGVAGVGKPEWTDDSAGTEPWPTPPPAPAWTEQPRSDQPWTPPTWTPPPGEQRTTQLPRNTDAGRFPYPAPAPPPSSSAA